MLHTFLESGFKLVAADVRRRDESWFIRIPPHFLGGSASF